MLTIRFEADIKNGMIKVPSKHKKLMCKHATITALTDEAPDTENVSVFSDEYIENHWRELLMTSHMSADFEKSQVAKQERANYLTEKYN